MAEKQFRVGQKVKIADMLDYDHPNSNGSMLKWRGKTVTIARTNVCDRGCCYYIEEDGKNWHWASRWMTPVDDGFIELQDKEAILYRVESNGDKPLKKMERKVAISDLLAKITSERNGQAIVETPILPNGTRFYQKIGKDEIVVVEQSPQVRTINVQSYGKFTVSLPYVVYFFYLYEGEIPNYQSRMFFRNAPIESLADKLYHSNVTHVNNRKSDGIGHICTSEDVGPTGNLSEKIIAKMNGFWDSNFRGFESSYKGNNLTDSYHKSRNLDPKISSLEAWQAASALDPLFVLGIPWMDTGRTVSEMLYDIKDRNKNESRTNIIQDTGQLADLMYRLKEAE
jgi:hypothetical protein